ncbi:MAG: NUDIX domain-containing protein [Chloroflexota bacterium]|nr:NUDIX domain-containing protein [Chloroflexota bacterium]
MAMPRAAALILQGDSIALIERYRDDRLYYVFPGGQVKQGEALHDAAVREIKEELGLVIEIHRLVAELSRDSGMQYFFLAGIIGGEFGTGHGREMTGRARPESGTYTPVWMPVAELLQKRIRPRRVARLVVKAIKEGWPEEMLKLDDSSSARPGVG